MKKLMKLMAVAIVAISPLIFVAPTSAQQAPTLSCEIGYTGPDSNNNCTMSYSCSITETNTNNVVIVNESDQEVASGEVVVDGNDEGGQATSGTVTNENGTVFTVVITNGDSEEVPQTCAAAVVVPATVTPVPVTPVEPQGQGQVTVLPKTSSNEVLGVAALVAALFSLTALIAVAGVVAYRNLKSSR